MNLGIVRLSQKGAGSPGPAHDSRHGVLTILKDMVTSTGLLTPLLLHFQPISKSGQESGTRPQKSPSWLKFSCLELGQLM